MRKRLYLKTQNVAATGYYNVEDPIPDAISKLRRFKRGYEVLIVGCKEPLIAVILVLRKLLLLEGS